MQDDEIIGSIWNSTPHLSGKELSGNQREGAFFAEINSVVMRVDAFHYLERILVEILSIAVFVDALLVMVNHEIVCKDASRGGVDSSICFRISCTANSGSVSGIQKMLVKLFPLFFP